MALALPHGGRLIRSLVVDDDASIGAVLKELISRDNVSVDVFTDSRRAIAYISRTPVDIVITDLRMGPIDGLDVLRCAKQANPESVVIIITGHATLETAIDAVREGAYDYIKKPFKLREIELAFEKALERVHLVQNNKELLRELDDTRIQLAVMKQEIEKLGEQARKKSGGQSPLRFFPNHSLDFGFAGKTGEDANRLYQRLEKFAQLKKDGLLTDQEFATVKSHIIKSLKRSEA